MAIPDPSTVLPGTATTNSNGFSTTAVMPVPNASIQPASPITMPSVQTTNPVDANAMGLLLGTQAQNTQQTADQTQQAADTEAQNNSSLSDLLLGREAFSQQQAQNQNLPALQKQESDLRSASMLQTAQYIQGIRNIDQKNIAQGERNTAQVEAQRQNAIDALLTNAQLSFTQGQIQSAQAQVKAAVDLKYNAIEQKIANSDKVLARLDLQAGKADSKAVQAAKDRNDQLKADITEKKAQDLKIQQTIIDATPFAPPEVISQAQQAFKDGKSSLEVAQALGQYGGDYLTREKIKAEIRKMDADAAKVRADAKGTGVTGASAATSNAKNWVAQYNSGAMSLEDIYTKIGSTKEALALKNEVSRLIAEQKGKRVYGTDDATIQAINAQVKNVNDLLNGDVGSIVGLVQGGLGVLPDEMNIYKQDALAVAKNLVSNQTLQALADAKSKGITFGALSEGELGLVADAAGRISSKLIKDKEGNITGFSGSEGQFKDDLKLIKDNLEKSIATKTGNQSTEDKTADDIMTANKRVNLDIKNSYNIFDK